MLLHNCSIANRRSRHDIYGVVIALAVWIWLCASASVAFADGAGLGPADPADARPAPEFSIQDLSGASHSLGDYRGKALVVNFWATWCPPCIKEMPALQNAWQQLKAHGVQVLGINMGETADDIQQFMQQASLTIDFPLLLDENMEQGPLWSLKGLPTTYIINPDGQIVYTVVGEREWDDAAILDQIRALAAP